MATCFWDNHVILTKRNTGLKRFAETHRHDLVTEDNDLFLTTVTVNSVDDLADFFLPQQTVDQAVTVPCGSAA